MTKYDYKAISNGKIILQDENKHVVIIIRSFAGSLAGMGEKKMLTGKALEDYNNGLSFDDITGGKNGTV